MNESRHMDQEITRADIEHWLQICREVDDSDTALDYAQRAAEVMPDDPAVQRLLQNCIFEILEEDAFLGFVSESKSNYVISFRNSRPIVVPKSRNPPEPFPPSKIPEGERALRMVWWLMLGLVPAGLGALILGPFVMQRALKTVDRPNAGSSERRMAWLAFLLAAGFGLLGLLFASLLAIHLL